MGRRGPAPKPTTLKVLEGNPGKRAVNKREPRPARDGVRRPQWLKGEARKEWERMAPELRRLGLLTVLDRTAFAAYCMAYARWRDIIDRVDGVGWVGKLAPLKEAEMAMIRFGSRFGFSPADRTQLQADKPGQPEDELTAFRRRKDRHGT